MKFNLRLRELREEKGITYSQLAANFNKTDAAIRSWENGRTTPDYNTLIKLAEFFDCSTDYLLGLSSLKNPNSILKLDSSSKKINQYISSIVHFNTNYLVFSEILLLALTNYIYSGEEEDNISKVAIALAFIMAIYTDLVDKKNSKGYAVNYDYELFQSEFRKNISIIESLFKEKINESFPEEQKKAQESDPWASMDKLEKMLVASKEVRDKKQ